MSSQAIAHQLLAQITFFRFNECIKTLKSALTHRIGHMRQYSERLRQLLLRKIFRRTPYFDVLRHSNTKKLRLFVEPSWRYFVRFGRVNEVQAKRVYLFTSTHMKAVAIISRVRDESAIFQHNPIF